MTTGFDCGFFTQRDSSDRRPYWPVLENATMITRMPWLIRYIGPFLLAGLIPGIILGVEQDQFGTPKGSEGTRIFKADEHPRYTGQFRINGYRAVLVGSMNDASPWDHLDYAGKHLSS